MLIRTQLPLPGDKHNGKTIISVQPPRNGFITLQYQGGGSMGYKAGTLFLVDRDNDIPMEVR